MKIDHVSLYTKDLEQSRNFYETYFRAKANQKYGNPKTGLETYFLTFEDGARLEIMTRPGLHEGLEESLHTGWTHLAFQLGSREEVDRLTQRIAADGFPILSGPRVTGDGYYESCTQDPDGNQIELVG